MVKYVINFELLSVINNNAVITRVECTVIYRTIIRRYYYWSPYYKDMLLFFILLYETLPIRCII